MEKSSCLWLPKPCFRLGICHVGYIALYHIVTAPWVDSVFCLVGWIGLYYMITAPWIDSVSYWIGQIALDFIVTAP